MKTSITNLATILILGAAIAVPAFAAVNRADIQQTVNSSIGGDNTVFTFVNDGVVTISGRFGGAYDKASAINAAERLVGADRVIDRSHVSR